MTHEIDPYGLQDLELRRVLYRMHQAIASFAPAELPGMLETMGLAVSEQEVRSSLEDLAMSGALSPDGAGGYVLNERRAA